MLRLVRRDGVRLIVVTGPPGIGKTRFAVEVARELSNGPKVVLLDDADPGDLPGDRADAVIVATSTTRLGISGERGYPLRPLAEAPAVELFRQRAEAAVPGFVAGYAELADLCRRLGRLPLSIELVAARGGAALHEPLGREWSLEGAIAWTYERLDERGKGALRKIVADASAAGIEVAVDTLADLRLVVRTESGVRVHPAIRAFAASV